jgi:hypothetical protein
MNKLNLEILAYLLIIISDFCGFLFTFIKLYRILCFTRLTFDQLPIFNPYKWPLAFIRISTNPYFRFWSKLLPNLKIGKVSYDISGIVGLEVLAAVVFFTTEIRMYTFLQAEQILSKIGLL